MRKLHITFFLTALLSFSSPATFSTIASWQAAGTQTGTIDFESLSSGQVASFALSGLSFTGLSGNLIVFQSGYTWSDLGQGQSLTTPEFPGGMQINLPADTFGFGFLVGSSAGIPVNVVVDGLTLLIDSPTNPPANVGNPALFWGIRSDSAISSLTIAASNTGYRAIIDNFTWGGQATGGGGTGGGGGTEPPLGEVPEVSSGLLIGAALLLAPIVRKRLQGVRN